MLSNRARESAQKRAPARPTAHSAMRISGGAAAIGEQSVLPGGGSSRSRRPRAAAGSYTAERGPNIRLDPKVTEAIAGSMIIKRLGVYDACTLAGQDYDRYRKHVIKMVSAMEASGQAMRLRAAHCANTAPAAALGGSTENTAPILVQNTATILDRVHLVQHTAPMPVQHTTFAEQRSYIVSEISANRISGTVGMNTLKALGHTKGVEKSYLHSLARKSTGGTKKKVAALGAVSGPTSAPPTAAAGNRQALPAEFITKLIDHIIALRAVTYSNVPRDTVIGYANVMLSMCPDLHADVKKRFVAGALDINWYNRFIKLPEVVERLVKTKTRGLEIDRAKAGHSGNFAYYFVQTAEIFVSAGVAIWNPEFDPNFDPRSDPSNIRGQMVLITHPGLILEYDESEMTVDQTKETQVGLAPVSEEYSTGGKKKKVAQRDSVANKTSNGGSLVAGSLMNGNQMIPMYISTGKSFDGRWLDSWGTVEKYSVLLTNGKRGFMDWVSSPKGGSTNQIGLHIMQNCVLSTLNANDSVGTQFRCKREDEPAWRFGESWACRTPNADQILYSKPELRERTGVVLADGLSHHFTAEALAEMAAPTQFNEDAAMGIEKRYPIALGLKPPHSTDKLQTCDRKNFAHAKPEWGAQKAKKLQMNILGVNVVDGVPVTNEHGHVYLDEQQKPLRPVAGFAGVLNTEYEDGGVWVTGTKKLKLDYFDVTPCLGPVLDKSFASTVNITAYSEAGLGPCTSLPYWQVKAQEENRKMAVKAVGGSARDIAFDPVTMITGKRKLSSKSCTDDRVPNDVASMESRGMVGDIEVVTSTVTVSVTTTVASPVQPGRFDADLVDSGAAGGSVAVANRRDPRLSGMQVVSQGPDRGVHLSTDTRDAAAQARAANRINSSNLWHKGNLAQPDSDGANMVFENSKKKQAKAIENDAAAAKRKESKRQKLMSWAEIGASAGVQDKLEDLQLGEPSADTVGKAFTVNELKGLLVHNRGDCITGSKTDLAKRLHLLLWPQLTQPTLLLTNHR